MVLSSLHLFCLSWWIDLAISNPAVLNLRTSHWQCPPLLIQPLYYYKFLKLPCVFVCLVILTWLTNESSGELFPVRTAASRFGIQRRYNHKWLLQRLCKNYMWLKQRTEFEHTTRGMGMGVRRANPLHHRATNSVFFVTLGFLLT